ncbi:MAG: HNH endonuclease [Tagaea sp.]
MSDFVDYAISRDRLLELLDYDPATGAFVRRIAFGGRPAGERVRELPPIGHRYCRISIDHVRCHAHRLAWLHHHGHHAPLFIDHINGVTWDNRIVNLRLATPQQNQQNIAIRRSNTSGVMGVDQRRGRWRARITHNGKFVHLGFFDTRNEAVQARQSAERELWTHRRAYELR